MSQAEKNVLVLRQLRSMRDKNEKRDVVRDYTHCPECKAPKGSPCRRKSGSLRVHNHRTRHDLWKYRNR